MGTELQMDLKSCEKSNCVSASVIAVNVFDLHEASDTEPLKTAFVAGVISKI